MTTDPQHRPNGLGYVLELNAAALPAAESMDREHIARQAREIAAWVRDQAKVISEAGLEVSGFELEDGATAIDRFAEEVDGPPPPAWAREKMRALDAAAADEGVGC